MGKNVITELTTLFNKLSVPQRLIIGGAIFGSFVVLGIIMMFMNEPEYGTLFTNLQQEDAAKVVEHLNKQQIPYSVADDGRIIKIPDNQVYETRLELSSQGIPGSGIVGYEIFDKNTMGMSEFMQKLNYKRALEGELSRTISQQEGVEGARVHIVIPEKSVFREEEKLPTASVLLKLKNSKKVNNQYINAIVNLISSSVEGLLPTNVTVLDSKGRLLSKESSENRLTASSTTNYELKQDVENYLANKAQSILDNVLGYGNAMIKVNVELNFDQVEKTMQTFDPESQVAISEQLVAQQNNDRSIADSTSQQSQNTITNYEVNKSVEKVIHGIGTIKKMTVSAVVNDIMEQQEQDGEFVTVYTTRPVNQLRKLESIVKNAVGFDMTRTDQFSIVNIPFETKLYEVNELTNPRQGVPIYEDYEKMMNLIFVIIAIIGAIIVVKKLLGKVNGEKLLTGDVSKNDTPEFALQGAGANIDQTIDNMLPESMAQEKKALEAPAGNEFSMEQLVEKKREFDKVENNGNLKDEISIDAIKKKERHDKIANYVADNPQEAAKLIHAWLFEDEQ